MSAAQAALRDYQFQCDCEKCANAAGGFPADLEDPDASPDDEDDDKGSEG